MKRLVLALFISLLSLLFLPALFLSGSDAATNADYCQVPPYVVQNVPANIMIVLDNSLSMLSFAYYDGMYTTTTADDKIFDVNGDGIDNDYPCTNSGDPCTDFTVGGTKTYPGVTPQTDDDYKYYGYFDPDYWYTYGSSRFTPTAPKTGSGLTGARAKAAAEWDGNFLNWLTMRRVDIVRKVMTGGTTTGTGANTRLLAEMADYERRGVYKKITNAENYINSTYSGDRCFIFNTAGSGTSTFRVRDSGSCTAGSDAATFSVDVSVPSAATVFIEGLLQNLVSTKARLGLTFYSTSNQGGKVQVSVGGATLSSTVNQINLTRPSTNTPLAETLWTVAGYFGQMSRFQGFSSGPGPRYASGDYTINNTNDPYNQGTGGSPRWPACTRSYVLLITDGTPCSDGNLPSDILNYAQSAGSSFNCGSPLAATTCPAAGPFAAAAIPSCGPGDDVAGIEDVALWMHTKDLRNYDTLGGTSSSGAINGTQNLTLYTVFAFGSNSSLIKYAAINGGFEDSNSNNIPDLQSEWDKDGDDVPDNYYEATDGYEIENAVRNALSTMLKRASSGTAASVLASGEGSGANLIQAVFYPSRRFGNDVINWTGSLQNLWYYVDPFFTNSNIREDTLQETPDRTLHLINDFIAQLYFDTTSQTARARRFGDTDGDGDADTTQTTVAFESVGNIWEAGNLLWNRDVTVAATKRKIYTTINGTSFLSGNFSKDTLNGDADKSATLLPYFDLPTSGDINTDGWIDGNLDHNGTQNSPYTGQTIDAADAAILIRYIHGEDIDLDSDGLFEHRQRTVTIGGTTKVWKLGDILNSTPKIASWLPLNSYNTTYKDTTYSNFVNDRNDDGTAKATPVYTNRGMVFAGGNDGMLHAFKLGTLELRWSGQTATLEKARLTNPDPTTPLGHEMWAFIPKNVLPYLRHIMDPDYCHIYSVDFTPYIFDASINIDPAASGQIAACSDVAYSDYWRCIKSVNSWKTILIGGMRTGGACRGTTTVCTDVSGDGQKDCVNTPVDVSGQSVGYSSYFALDITDPNTPQLLWEFSHPELGFATTGPAVVRIRSRTAGATNSTADPGATTNGRWFVVFGSGPTGPISSGDSQFLGRSDQNLKLFVLDLKTGALATTNPINTGIANAFAGSMLNATNDSDIDYQDDALYIPYVRRCAATTDICTNGAWTNGGVGRLFTNEDLNGNDVSSTGNTALNANNWVWNRVIDDVGPVTSAVARLEKKSAGLMWLYFGTGRYSFVQGSAVDDADTRRALFGIKDPCFGINGFDVTCATTTPTLRAFCATPCSNPPTCTEPSITLCGDLTNVTNVANTPANPDDAGFMGWYINLEPVANPTDPEAIANSSCRVGAIGTTTCTGGRYGYCEGDAATNAAPFCRNYKTERVITDPLATASGVVFFTTYKPYSDECDIGGKSFIWAVKYSTGGSAAALLKGTALMQVSTGSIEQLDMSTAFTGAGGRRSTALEGVPPTAQGLSLISTPPPVKRILHIRER